MPDTSKHLDLYKSRIISLSKGNFVRNVMAVASGTAIAQVVTLSSYPVISRLYGPVAFGVVGVFTASLAIIIPLAAFAYPISIVLPKKHTDARDIMALSLLLASAVALIATPLAIIHSSDIANIFNLHSMAAYIYLLPVALLFQATQDVGQQWLIRTRQFSLSAKVIVVQSVVINATKIGLGLVYPVAATLVYVTVAGFALQGAMYAFANRQFGQRLPVDEPVTPKNLGRLAKAYRDFPLFRAPQDLLNALAHGLPVILLASFYGSGVAGYYALAYSVLAAPISLVGNAVGNVLYPKLAEANNRGEGLRRLVVLPTAGLFLIGLIPFGIIMAFGPAIFSLVFGAEWREAGEYARWLALWMAFLFFNLPSNKAIPVLGLQHVQLAFGVFSTVVRTAALWVGHFFFGEPIYSVILYIVSGTVLNVLMVAFVVMKCDAPAHSRDSAD